MECACYTIDFTREVADFSFELAREKSGDFTLTWERTCEFVADLVAFSAADGHFFTSEGYTILVKI